MLYPIPLLPSVLTIAEVLYKNRENIIMFMKKMTNCRGLFCGLPM